MNLFANRRASPMPLRAFDVPERMTSPFEDWCESQGIHPDTFGAWEAYEATTATEAQVDLGLGPAVA
jgi:hypothetical protein